MSNETVYFARFGSWVCFYSFNFLLLLFGTNKISEISLPPFIEPIFNVFEVQRLADISQLGTCKYVFPSMNLLLVSFILPLFFFLSFLFWVY